MAPVKLSQNEGHRIGLFGGTFDPVHNGHIQIARTAREYYGFNSICFIPAFIPPHKDRVITGFHHRIAMLEAALAGQSEMEISLIESERTGPSYTYDTLQNMKREYADETTFFLLIGGDSFVEIHSWYKYIQLLEEVDLIVIARPGYSLEMMKGEFKHLPLKYSFREDIYAWYNDITGRYIYYLRETHAAVSSSQVRDFFLHGRSTEGLVANGVQNYIDENQLYRNRE